MEPAKEVREHGTGNIQMSRVHLAERVRDAAYHPNTTAELVLFFFLVLAQNMGRNEFISTRQN